MLKYSILFGTIFSIPQSPQQSNSSVQTRASPTGNIPTNSSLGSAIEATDGSAESSDAAVAGNCLTQRIDFSDPSRIFNLANLPFPIKDLSSVLDIGRYDVTLDYGNVTYSANNGLNMLIKENAASPKTDALGTRISTTRFMKYGRISAYFKAVGVPGVVTSFISAGPPLPDPILNGVPKDKIAKDTGDEIDIELLGKSPREATNNVFYRGLLEFSKHDQYHAVPNGIAAFNKWTFEWKRDTITFLLNDKVLRTYSKSGPEADSHLVPGVRFFPDRPQKIQMGLWASAVNTWSGGLPTWPDATKQSTASIQYIDITCYDDSDSPVPKWPNTAQNVERLATVKGQPTELIGGDIPPTAGKQSKGAIMQPPPAMPAGYTGEANKAAGPVADAGTNDGLTIASMNKPGNTAQFGNTAQSGNTAQAKKGAGESVHVSFEIIIFGILSVFAMI